MEVSRDNLPRSMRFAMTSVPAVQADCHLARFDSTNGVTFDPSGANEIRIRVKANGFIQSDKHYLYFEINNTHASQHAFVDGDAGCFFERLTIEANGTQVEQIDRYALWNGIVRNYQTDVNDIHKINVEGGGGQYAIVTKDSGDASLNGQLSATALSNLGEEIEDGESKIFCIQLNSGLLRNNFGKALPDGLIELEIILRLKEPAGALVSTGAVTYTLTNPRLYAPVYRIMNGDVMSSYSQLVGSGVSWIGHTVKTYVNSIANNGGSKSLQINDRSMSLNALITALRISTNTTATAKYSNTTFTINPANYRVENYIYKIAGMNYPSAQIELQPAADGRNVGRCHQEAIKALAKPGEHFAPAQVDREQFCATPAGYVSATDTAATTNAKGLLCVDLRKFNDKELRMVGLQTSANAAPSVLELQLPSNYQGGVLDATTYALVEAVWTMDNTGALRVAM